MLDALDFTTAQFAAIAAIALLGGLVRGFGGFGSALVVTPVLSIVVGARAAVPAVMIVLLVTTLQLIPSTWPHVRWRQQWALSIAGCVGVPLGGMVLLALDPEVLRRAISATTAASALLLMSGWRYSGSYSNPAAAAAGGLGGFISGAGSVGGPPVVAYLLAGPGSAAEVRADIVYYFVFTQVVSLVFYGVSGLLGLEVMVAALLIAPTLLIGTWIGTKLFVLASEMIFRRFALVLLLVIGVVTLAI